METMPIPQGESKTPRSQVITDKKTQYMVLLSAIFAAFMTVLDSYIVNISLPTISHTFNVSTSQVSWVTLAYLLVLTSTLLMFGKLSDQLGLKKFFITGYVFFTAGSLMCGLSSNLTVLIIARCIQALGSAMLYGTAQVVVIRFMPANIRGWAFGIFSIAAALGITMGAPIGGLITRFLSWHWIFLINIPFGIIAILLSHKFIPPDLPCEKTEKKQPFDVPGSVLIFVGLGCLLYAINMFQEHGGFTVPVIITGLVAAACLVAFYIRESKLEDPLLNFTMFKDRDFLYAILVQGFAFMVPAGTNFLLPFYLIAGRGLTPDKAGLLVLCYSAVFMPAGMYFGKLSDRVSPRKLCAIGMAVGVAACLFFSFTLQYTSYVPLLVFLVSMGVAFSMLTSPGNNLVMSLADPKWYGVTSSVTKTGTNLGQVLGLVLMESVFALSMPASMSVQGASASQVQVPPAVLNTGFMHAFWVAAGICLVTVIFCLMIRKEKYEGAEGVGEGRELEKVVGLE